MLLRGVSELFAWCAAWFWISLVLDWSFSLPEPARGALLVVGVLGGVVLLIRRLIGPLLRPISRESMALLVERRFPQFGEALLTAVEYADRTPTPGEEVFLADLDRRVHDELRAAPLWRIIRGGPLRVRFWTAIVLAVSVLGFVELAPAAFATWRDRIVQLGDARWPRGTRLVADAFQDGVVKTPRGADFDLVVRADLMYRAPESVQLRYRGDEGVRGRATMTRQGRAVAGIDAYQDFVYRLPALLASTTIDVYGGDDALRGLRIEVVDAPALAELLFDCEYPAYTGRGAAESVPLASVMRFPAGSRVTLRGRATKSLERVEVVRAVEELDGAETPEIVSPQGDEFTYSLAQLTGDVGLLLALVDQDGIRTRRPIRVLLQAIADEPPQVDARPTGVGVQITPQALAPISGTAADDYGVEAAWVQLQHNDQPPKSAGDVKLVDGELDAAAVDFRETLTLAPGDRVSLAVAARDGRRLGEGPQTTIGQRFVLNVVAPDDLRAGLESRELVMRARLESVMSELSATRDLLLQIEPDLEAVAAEEDADVDVDRLATMRRLRIERAGQNSRRFASETSGVATGFEDMAVELELNRIDAPDVRRRWLELIAEPLHRIGEDEFPAFDAALEELAGASEPADVEAARDRSGAAADALLIALGEVLDRIESLADFNELLDQLRSLIDAQDEIVERTKQRREDKIRELIGE